MRQGDCARWTTRATDNNGSITWWNGRTRQCTSPWPPDATRSASTSDAAALVSGGPTMTTYEVENEDSSGYHLSASWPDLPERISHPVATFQDPKLAAVAKTVLNAASRYRWRRWVELLDEGVFNETRDAGSTSLPALPTGAVLGDLPLGADLEEWIRALTHAGSGAEPPSSARFCGRTGAGTCKLTNVAV